MFSPVRTLVVPAYLFACLILGGSAQGIWANMVLQLAGVAIIAWAAVDRGDEPMSAPARHLLLLALAGIAIVALQFVPLPAEVWSRLPGRAVIADGFGVLGLKLPAQPLSLAPAGGMDSLLGIIPPLAVICGMLRLKAYRPQTLAIALIAGTVAGIALGALQVGGEAQSPWYLYADTNRGKGVGFFANANHMASLLLMSAPFVAAIASTGRGRGPQRRSAVIAVSAAVAIVVIVGIALNGSLAGFGLALPVAAASALLLLPPSSRWRMATAGAAAVLAVGAVVTLQMAPINAGTVSANATTSVKSRTEILSTTMEAAADFMPFGSGLGSFRSVYHLYEQPTDVERTLVVHAHNDYGELILELGVLAVVLILIFLWWWSAASWRVWTSPEPRPFARAAVVASAVILVHSLVDFPLRTAAIAACFAMCLALLVESRAAPPQEKAMLRRKRHVEFR